MATATEPRWSADPAGRHEVRYWDGDAWTDHVSDGGQQSEDVLTESEVLGAMSPESAPAAAGGVATAVRVPTKICPHCQAQSQTDDLKCPNCGKRYARRRRWPWALLAVFVLFGGCGALLIGGLNNAVDSLNKEQAAHAITKAQFDSVQLGISQSALESQLGKPPENTSEYVTKGVLSQADIKSSCVYYNEVGQSFGSLFQFCFDNDAMRSKLAS